MDTEKFVVLKKSEEATVPKLSDELYNIICRYVELNRYLQEINQLYDILQFNIEQFFINYELGSDDCVVRRDNFKSDHSNFIAVNAYIMNILSAGRSLVDSTDNCVKNTYGEKTDQYIVYKKCVLSMVYDSNFSYRFFYDLRNFAQHNHLPVSVNDGFCCFDTAQILNTPHFKSNKNVRTELEKLHKQIKGKYKDNFRISLSMCLIEYLVGVAQIYKGFWGNIKDLLFELKISIDLEIERTPELLEHNNEMFNSYILYQIPDKEGWQAFSPYSDTESYYENCMKVAQHFFEGINQEYETLKEHFREISFE